MSSIELGQGVVGEANNEYQGDLRPNFPGRLQPYSVYVPSTYDPSKPAPLTWLLHSLGVQHNQYGGLNPTLLQQACDRVPDTYRAAFLLWSQQHLSFAEVAAALEITETTARWRVFKARAFLLEQLEPYLDRNVR